VAFWDASAIIPLCCSQPATAQGRRLQREFTRLVVWWGTPIEARSAFARLVREERLTAVERVKAIRLRGQLRSAWDEILPSEKVRSVAHRLPRPCVVARRHHWMILNHSDEWRFVRDDTGEQIRLRAGEFQHNDCTARVAHHVRRCEIVDADQGREIATSSSIVP
jgi:hypothetical protein